MELIMIDREGRSEADGSERGKRAGFDPVTGEVHGSGSGAGANAGKAEDFDDDPTSGGGDDQVGAPRARARGVERSIDPDEGI
jgi:hypothetical protein